MTNSAATRGTRFIITVNKIYRSVHIPYTVTSDKWFEYEQRWKETAADLLNKHIPHGDRANRRVLDFGCGRGEFLNLLSSHGYACEGVDFDATCVRLSSQYATAHLADEHTLGDLFEPKSYDVVTAIHVLEHVKSPVNFVERLKTLSRKYLLLSVPNLQGTAYLPIRGGIYDANEGHLFGWDHAHFRNFVRHVCELELIEFAHDTVVLKTYFRTIDKFLSRPPVRGFVRWLETGWLLKKFPFLSHSIIALCQVA